jgi:hypothetical protein
MFQIRDAVLKFLGVDTASPVATSSSDKEDIDDGENIRLNSKYREWWNYLIQTRDQVERDIDSVCVNLSGGGLALSITLLQFTSVPVNNLPILIGAWIALLFALITGVTAMFMTVAGCDALVEIANYQENKRVNIGPHKEPSFQHGWLYSNLTIHILSIASIFLVAVGISLMSYFTVTNVSEKNNEARRIIAEQRTIEASAKDKFAAITTEIANLKKDLERAKTKIKELERKK